MAGYFLSCALFEVYTKYQGKKIKIFRNTEFDVIRGVLNVKFVVSQGYICTIERSYFYGAFS